LQSRYIDDIGGTDERNNKKEKETERQRKNREQKHNTDVSGKEERIEKPKNIYCISVC